MSSLLTAVRALGRRARLPAGALAVTLAVIPFGSLSALHDRVVSGRIVDTVSQGRFLATPRDDGGRISYQIAFIKRHPPSGPTVYLLGGSAVRECIPTCDRLTTAIERRCGVRARVRVMGACEQRLAGTLAIIDDLPPGDGDVVVIGVHHLSFVCGPAEARAQLTGITLSQPLSPQLTPSQALHDWVAARQSDDPPETIRAGLLLHLARYRDKRGVPAFRGASIAYRQHQYGQGSVLPAGAKRLSMRRWLRNRGGPDGPFYRDFDYSAALLAECVRLARAKGYEVLLMDCPQDAGVVRHAFDKYKAEYRPVCTQLVDTQGAHYANLNRTAHLVSGDFFDLYHLVPSGRVKWMPKLADTLAQIFTDHPPPALALLVAASRPAPSPAPLKPSVSPSSSPAVGRFAGTIDPLATALGQAAP